jgi:hypothetical protein
MTDSRIKCSLCENLILQVTFDRQLGTCGPCYRWIQVFINREEAGELDEFWSAIPTEADLPFRSLEEIREFIGPHLDQNLMTQRAITQSRSSVDCGILGVPENCAQARIGVVDPEQVIHLYHLMTCAPYREPWDPPTYRFSMTTGEIPPWPVVNGPVPIASADWLLEHLHPEPEWLQILPVRIEALNDDVGGYVALNILKSAHVWDLQRSTWEGSDWDQRTPLGLRHMVALENIEAPAPLFRSADFRPHVIATEATGKLICQLCPRSVVIESLDGYSS